MSSKTATWKKWTSFTIPHTYSWLKVKLSLVHSTSRASCYLWCLPTAYTSKYTSQVDCRPGNGIWQTSFLGLALSSGISLSSSNTSECFYWLFALKPCILLNVIVAEKSSLLVCLDDLPNKKLFKLPQGDINTKLVATANLSRWFLVYGYGLHTSRNCDSVLRRRHLF